MEISGALDVDALRRSLRQAFEECEALRCNFADTTGGPRQFIVRRETPLDEVDFGYADDAREAATRYMLDRMRRSFDLSVEPLVRTCLIRVSADRHFLFLRAHHLVLDGFGGGVLFDRLRVRYAHLTGETTAEPPAVPSLRLLVHDDMEYELSGRAEQDRRYWMRALDGGSAAARGHCLLAPSQSVLNPSVTGSLRRLSASMSSALVATTGTYVAGVLGAEQVRVGMVTHARDTARLRKVPGNAYNILPVTVSVPGGASLTDVVDDVFQQLKGALRHQRYRAEDIARDLRIPLETFFDCILNLLPPSPIVAFRSCTWELNVLGAGPPDDSYVTFQTSAGDSFLVESGDRSLAADRDGFLGDVGGLAGFIADSTGSPRKLLEPKCPAGRPALPAMPAMEAMEAGHGSVRPRTATEEMLCEVLAQVLGKPSVTPDRTFIGLGGSSLSALMAISRIRALFGVDLRVHEILGRHKVADVARRIEESRGARQRPALVPMPPVSPVPTSGSQRTMLRFQAEYGESLGVDNLCTGFRIDGRVDVSLLRSALEDVVRRHQSLRTLFPGRGRLAVQQVLDPDDVNVVVDEADVPPRAGVNAMLSAAGAHSFHLDKEIPLRVILFRTVQDAQILLLVLHHVALDALSVPPLLRDFQSALAARAAGREPEWEPLQVQFTDYALWERELLGTPERPTELRASQLAYWRTALLGAPAEVSMPFDRPRPDVSSQRGASIGLSVDATLHRGIVKLAERCGVTSFMVVQAAIAVLMTRSGAGTDILLGSPVAGRADPQLDALVGCFVNTLALRIDTTGDPTVEELLIRVRTSDLEAFSNQDLPFADLTEALGRAGSFRHHPLFQVYLALDDIDGLPQHGMRLGDMAVEPVRVDQGTNPYDLVFWLKAGRTPDGDVAGMHGRLFYAADLFDESTVMSTRDRLVTVLKAMVHSPDGRILELDVER